MTTIREIAAKAGYSPATVSRLLNNDPTFSVSDIAKKKILKTAQTLNYQQSAAAKGIIYQVAVIFSVMPKKELEDVYFSNLRKSIITYGEKANLALTFYQTVADVPESIDGFIAIGQFQKTDLYKMKTLSANNIFVDSNPEPNDFNSVQPNLQALTEQAIDSFRMSGITSIGFIGGDFWNADHQTSFLNDSRKKYFESHMRELNIFDANHVFIGSDFSVESGYALGEQVIQSLGKQAIPRGFLIASDPLAVGVLQAFNEHKITVPTDTAIISINDIDIAKYVSPPLTTFHIDTDELGRLAINTLKETIIFGNRGHRTTLLAAPLIYRKSFLQPTDD